MDSVPGNVYSTCLLWLKIFIVCSRSRGILFLVIIANKILINIDWLTNVNQIESISLANFLWFLVSFEDFFLLKFHHLNLAKNKLNISGVWCGDVLCSCDLLFLQLHTDLTQMYTMYSGHIEDVYPIFWSNMNFFTKILFRTFQAIRSTSQFALDIICLAACLISMMHTSV